MVSTLVYRTNTHTQSQTCTTPTETAALSVTLRYRLCLVQPSGGSRDPPHSLAAQHAKRTSGMIEVREKVERDSASERHRDPLAATLSGCKRWQT